MLVQPGLCRTRWETTLFVFPRKGSYVSKGSLPSLDDNILTRGKRREHQRPTLLSVLKYCRNGMHSIVFGKADVLMCAVSANNTDLEQPVFKFIRTHTVSNCFCINTLFQDMIQDQYKFWGESEQIQFISKVRNLDFLLTTDRMTQNTVPHVFVSLLEV